MRKVSLIAAAALALALPAKAADKGAPATLDQILVMPNAGTALQGCYGEVSAAGAFLAAGPREATGGVGAGCTIKHGLMMSGLGFRADWGDFTAGSMYARGGVLINPNLAIYSTLVWKVPDWKAARTGTLAVGGGLETTLFRPELSGFVEADVGVKKWGAAATKDDITVRTGIRWYLK